MTTKKSADQSQDSKISAAITVEQPTKLDIRGGDDNDFAVNVERQVRLNVGHGDDNDSPSVKLNIGASDPAEQA
jgi:hypothetical protein